jgi:hypothetical protein
MGRQEVTVTEDDGKKKRTGKKRPLRGRVSQPPPVASVVSLFGEDAKKSAGPVVIPPPGIPGQEHDSRKRHNMDPLETGTKTRLGKRWSQIFDEVERQHLYTWDEFCQSLSPTELARGTLADKNGNFAGRPPKFVPRQFLNACTRELLRRGGEMYRESYTVAIEAMTSIAGDRTAKASERIKAAQFVIERIEGKIPDRVVVSAEDPWQVALDGIVAEVAEDEAIARAHTAAYDARAADADAPQIGE